MNDERRERRPRAVRLTDDGLRILQDRLNDQWPTAGNSGRQTRATRAAMLDLSVGTATRLLEQKGNDKAVLVQAFEKLGIRWDDRYCEVSLKEIEFEEHVSDPPTLELGTAESKQALAEEVIESSTLAARRPWVKPLVALSALLVVGTAIVISAWQRTPAGPTPDAIVEKYIIASRLALSRADFVAAEKSAREALRLAKVYRQAGNIAYALQLKGGALGALGRLEESAACYAEALPFWTMLENPHERASLFDSLGVTTARLGRLDEAEKHFSEALKICRKVNDLGVTAGVLRGLGSVEAVRGEYSSALQWYDAAIMVLKDRPDEAMHIDLKALRALVLRDQGDNKQALKDLQDCLGYWKFRGERRWVATTLFQMASVHAAMGDRKLGEQAIREAAALFKIVKDKSGEDQCTKWLVAKEPNAFDLKRRLEEYF